MPDKSYIKKRIKLTFIMVSCGFLVVFARLFYWQVIKAESSQTIVDKQSTEQVTIRGRRGRIYADQGELLVGNQSVFDIYLNKRELEIELNDLLEQLGKMYGQLKEEVGEDIFSQYRQAYFQASELEFMEALEKVSSRDSSWIRILPETPRDFKEIIQEQNFAGLHFFETEARFYPEGSMAAHLTGFVGKDKDNKNTGYFGIEGALNKELESKTKEVVYKKDGRGISFADQQLDYSNLDGRDFTLTIRREIQFIAENALKEGVKRSQSKNGEIVIMDPKTGAVLAIATWPHYNQALFRQFDTHDYKNPALVSLYEPGSTFKVLTLAAGLDLDIITPETECTKCDGPRVIADHTINTWNRVFNPGITMSEALRLSDNTAMVFVSEQIGAERFMDYIRDFGIGEPLNIDLQEDTRTPLPNRVGPVELATISFGQGIMTNTMQMTRAVGAIANKGVMMKPHIVRSTYDPQTNEEINHNVQELRRVISTESAKTITKMMVHSASKRESWINDNYLVAGKSGTSQIPSETGGYKERGTIASYIGFAPVDDPKFVMIVKLTEPQLDLWGETTAVPIWYDVAEKIMLRL